MNISIHRLIVPGLAALCGVAAIGLIPAVHLWRADSDVGKETARAVRVPGLGVLQDEPPSMSEVVAKHLFVQQRKATGQNSFADLVVKGLFLGTEKSAIFSLKSKPDANLRVWMGQVESVLSQIVDPRDPRQTIATFLREWELQDITTSGVVVKHFITGETETYAVNYTPTKKVKDDASRGYGQGIMPQGGGGEAGAATVAKASAAAASAQKNSSSSSGMPPVSQMAEGISRVMQRLSPEEQKQLLQKLGQSTKGSTQKSGSSSGTSSKTGSTSNSSRSKNKSSKN